jgi:putative membrane protein
VSWLRLVLLGLGVALLIGLVVGHDPAAVFASLRELSWRFVVILLFPAVPVMILDTLGWRYAFMHDRVPFVTLLRTRLVGEAFNLVTPTAALGGEGVKAWLLRDRLPLEETVPSVIIAKTTITLAQGVFLLLGIAVASMGFGRSPLLLGMQWLLGLEVLALVIFIVVQTRGVVGWSVGQLERLGVRPEGAAPTAARVDRTLRTFYRHTPTRLTLSIVFHLMAWLLGAIEAYLILQFLGIPVSLGTATVIEAFGTGVRFATFLVPASLGVQEGGFAVTFVALGLSATDGIAFGLVRRLRELVWVAVGLVLFAGSRRPVVAAAPSPPD